MQLFVGYCLICATSEDPIYVSNKPPVNHPTTTYRNKFYSIFIKLNDFF